MLVVAALLSSLIGLSLGLLGGGGSILTVPILVYALGVEPKRAIAMSLLVVALASAAAMSAHARAGRVRYKTGIFFGAAGMAGAYAGGRIAHHLPGAVLLIAFAILMLVTATAMMRGRRGAKKQGANEGHKEHEMPVLKTMALGATVGMVTGIIGAGGGFVIVPALALLAGLPMSAAVGTSLLVITMNSMAGFAGYVGHANIDWSLTLIVSSAAVLGSFVGTRLAGRVSQESLRRIFAWFVLAMALFMLGKQLPPSAVEWMKASFVRHWPIYSAGIVLVVALTAVLVQRRRASALEGGLRLEA